MTGKELVKAMRAGQRVYGTLVVSPAPEWLKVVEGLNLDYVFIDTEHIAADRMQVSWMCRAFQAIKVAPLVRIPSPDPYQACMVLDAGAAGVIAPYIETPEQVMQLVGATKHKPIKGRYLQQLLDGTPAPSGLRSYLDELDGGNAMIVNIESVPAMEALDEILAVPGLDAVLVGPHDLSCSLGIPEEWDNPKFIKAVDTIITKARVRGVSAGIHIMYEAGLEAEVRWAKLGANFIFHHGDILSFRFAMKRDLAWIKQELGERPEAAKGESLNI